jgi:flavorubredoxin
MITDTSTGTSVHEIARGIYRIGTPVALPDGPGAFSFNQYLVVDDEPLLFHTGQRMLFPQVRAAIAAVMPPERLRWIGFAHFEADECGALNAFLALAPHATPLCGQVAAMTSIGDFADRAPRALADGEELSTGSHAFRWIDAPHVPHGWENGFLHDTATATLFCGDLFTQGGRGETPLVAGGILEASEAFRAPMDYYAHAPATAAALGRLASLAPRTLACMHGSSFEGDGAAQLRDLASALGATSRAA